MNNYFIIGLVFSNLLLIYYYNKKKFKIFFSKKKIKSVDLREVNNIFLPLENIEFQFPKEDTLIKNFFINPSFNVVGMTSDYESWIMSCLAKSSKIYLNLAHAAEKPPLYLPLIPLQKQKFILLL